MFKHYKRPLDAPDYYIDPMREIMEIELTKAHRAIEDRILDLCASGYTGILHATIPVNYGDNPWAEKHMIFDEKIMINDELRAKALPYIISRTLELEGSKPPA